MSFDEKTIFVKPDIFKSCKTLTQTDLTKIVNAFNDTLISKETLENIGLNIFQLTFGELENIKNENRALMIRSIVVRWHEKNGNVNELDLLCNLLDKNSLVQVKELWWSEYFVDSNLEGKNDYLKKRKEVVKDLSQEMSDDAWSELLKYLEISTELDQTKSLDRQRTIEEWTLKNGYIKANLALLEKNLNDFRNNTNDLSLPNVSSTKCDFGLVYAMEDKKIASRIEKILKKEKFTVLDYHKSIFAGGKLILEIPSEFCESCTCILWICTKTSSASKGCMGHARDTLQYHSVEGDQDRGVSHFVALIPRGSDQKYIPSSLKAYQPLVENDRFVECLHATHKRMKSKQEAKMKSSFDRVATPH